MKNNMTANHLGDMAFIEECTGEIAQTIDAVVLFIRPVKGLHFGLLALIGVIFCVHPVRDDKDLHILEKPKARCKALAMITIDLIKGFSDLNPPAFQLNMHQRQTIDQDRHIIAINAVAFLCDLMHHLKSVLAPFVGVEEIDADLLSIITSEPEFLAENMGTLKNISLIEVVEDTEKFIIREACIVMSLKLKFQIGK